MNEGKKLSFKWFNFLYGWFIVEIVLNILGTFSNFGSLNRYKSIYGSLYGINEVVYAIIFCTIVRIILKIIAVSNKHKEGGYLAINAVLVWDLVHWLIWGSQYGFLGAVLCPLGMSAFIIPSFMYFKKRKFVYDDFYQSQTTKCKSCGYIDRTFFDACPKCGSYAKEYVSANELAKPKEDKIRFCRKCGDELIDNSKFCRKCGAEIIKKV